MKGRRRAKFGNAWKQTLQSGNNADLLTNYAVGAAHLSSSGVCRLHGVTSRSIGLPQSLGPQDWRGFSPTETFCEPSSSSATVGPDAAETTAGGRYETPDSSQVR
eukprot:CAMPEP_0197423958 /NCGR_PEP_ID=MMETSP1170-20131217/23790_1 /TAXON_ID=54406 /ORGANISM="Sarcinochrysis sp, Strain CCMP770" /LENGTH=104 /DNA_ID=CAMNT_0042951417 /DNA_START=48 /DNA_END=360 /DNA_ORIENTATION=+